MHEKNMLVGKKGSMVWQNGKLKLYSRKLASGRCQVKFYWNSENMNPVYGYLLTDGHRTFREVILEIRKEVDRMKSPDWYYHRHLYQLGIPQECKQDLIIFNYKKKDNSC